MQNQARSTNQHLAIDWSIVMNLLATPALAQPTSELWSCEVAQK